MNKQESINSGMTISLKGANKNNQELKKAYKQIKSCKEALERLKEESDDDSAIDHPRYIKNPEQKALAYWRWAYEKVKKREGELL